MRRTTILILTLGALLAFLFYPRRLPYTATTPYAAAVPSEPIPAPQWQYSTQTDEMTGQTERIACIESPDKLDFDAPYRGGSTVELCFRNSVRHGRDAILRISRGQFICSSYSCTLHLRADDGPVRAMTGREPSDYRSTSVFLPYNAVLTAVRHAHSIRIEAQFYEEGRRVIRFDTQGLDWK